MMSGRVVFLGVALCCDGLCRCRLAPGVPSAPLLVFLRRVMCAGAGAGAGSGAYAHVPGDLVAPDGSRSQASSSLWLLALLYSL
jgi:hypothetical protein